ncbi:hypothetical protein [Haliscomenobacter sp.]|uniref:hypothetical protein n=1 Tax=Haliscomenobacter sp. TaxID=2717303 RepID=UPI0035939687
MIPIEEAIAYFHSDGSSFWSWVEDGQVIEWKNGDTICYQKDLIELLKGIQSVGLPPLDAILLAISACHYGQLKNEHKEILLRFHVKVSKRRSASNNLNAIFSLPLQLRSGAFRVHLFREIFRDSPHLIAPYKAKELIQLLDSGNLKSHLIQKKAQNPPEDRLEIAFESFANIYDANELELILRTGLEQIPEPASLPTPEPIPSNDDLLTQLSQDPQTAGLARLTKRLIAALNIPPHTQGASDQPLGGVSDISNRGDFDRLLLSELANDDDTLSARLVNNEALYLRRETPPDPQVQERVILVDTSLRLWGTPRVFAVSAALGCALNNHQKAGISAFALGKEIFGPNALATKEEVILFLEQQSPVLHSGEALRAFFRQQPQSAQRAVFFITSEEVMADKNFSLIFAEQQQHLDYLLVLSRTGTLLFYKLVNGQRSLMNTSVFDLEALLFEPKKSAMLAALLGSLDLQPEHAIKHYGLFLPSYPGKLKREDVAYDGTALVAVLPSKRVWLWHSAQKGAIEVLDTIEEGGYSFYLVDHELKCIIVYTKGHKFMAYLFENNELSAVVDLYAKLIRYHPQQNVVNLQEIDGQVVACAYEGGDLFIGLNLPASPNYYYSYKNITHRIDLKTHIISLLPEKRFIPKEHSPLNLRPIKKMVHAGYSVLRNIKTIGFTLDGGIQLDQHRIILQDGKLWLIKTPIEDMTMLRFEPENRLDIQFYTRSTKWPNGSQIILDSRGFLKFFRPKSPAKDFTIALIIGQELGACANIGYYAGNPYFFNARVDQVTTPTDFYNRFIVPFINALDKP